MLHSCKASGATLCFQRKAFSMMGRSCEIVFSCKTPKKLPLSHQSCRKNETFHIMAAKGTLFHGGQDWLTTENLVEDFGTTTSMMGPHPDGLSQLAGNLHKLAHYPPLDHAPYRSQLANFLDLKHERLVLGNGSSELIDMCIRLAPPGGYITGPFDVQYKEYENSCARYNRPVNKVNPSLMVMVNPNNPTGDYLPIDNFKAYLERVTKPGMYVIIDESMQPWYGPEWREHALYHQFDWIQSMLKKNIHVIIIHSWTKLFSCPGIRIGSAILPCMEDYDLIVKHQVPWNVNIFALEYLSKCVTEGKAYLSDTWQLTCETRARMVQMLSEAFPYWQLKGAEFTSWIWVDTGSEEEAEKAVDVAKSCGCPIRWGKYGYQQPTHIRFAVRSINKFRVLYDALVNEM